MSRIAALCLLLGGCTWSAGLGVDATNENELVGVVRGSQEIDKNAEIWYVHESDPTTTDDGWGRNIFGLSIKHSFLGDKN